MSDIVKSSYVNRLYFLAKRVILSVQFWFITNTLVLVIYLGVHFSIDKSKLPSWWADSFGIVTNLLVGGIVSFLFYFLVVFIPENRKKRIFKNNLRTVYRHIKKDILLEVIHASIIGGRTDLEANTETINKLMTPKGFQDAFRGGREATEGFYAFENQMSYDTPQFQEIIMNFRILQKQIEFILNNYTIDDQQLFNFFMHLQSALIKLQYSETGYDESRSLCGFIYQILGGWRFIEGFRDYDIVEKMIDDI